jgi:hypothetical protein
MSTKTAVQKQSSLADYLAIIIAVIIVLLPFHAILTTWAGSNFGYIDVFRIWKEIILLFLTVGVVWLLVKRPKLRSEIINSRLFILFVFYLFFCIFRGLSGLVTERLELDAFLYGLIANLRYIVFFFVVLIVSRCSDILLNNWKKVIITPAVVVILFALMQKILLDPYFLEHFGYGPNTISPVYTIDNKTDYIRVQSTLRGPNPLGAYLVLIISAMSVIFVRAKDKINYLKTGLVIALGLLALIFSFSRSAWLGLLVSVILVWVVSSKKQYPRNNLIAASVVCFGLLSGVVYLNQNNDTFQNTFFHSDEYSASARSANSDRAHGIKEGLLDVVDNPLGQGPGSAGPASTRNKAKAKIAENYYIQIAQEVGVFGLFVLATFHVLVAYELYKRREHDLALILFVSFVGISIINLVSHAWMDDTISMMWWGLAGIALSQPVIINNKRHEQKSKN